MNGNGAHYANRDQRGASRYDSYHDRSTDSRGGRARGGFRGGRGHDYYSGGLRGRGRGFGRPDRFYGGRGDGREGARYRDPNSRDAESPRDSPRDATYRDYATREHPYHRDNSRNSPRDENQEFLQIEPHSVRREPDDLRQLEEKDRPRATETLPIHTNGYHQNEKDGLNYAEKLSERPPRPGIRGPSRVGSYGQKRGSDSGHGSYKGSGSITPINTATESSLSAKNTLRKSSAELSANPWISLLKLGEGKTAARVEQNYKELTSVNDKLAHLQGEKLKLTCALSTLDVYAKRDALNVEICNEKLDEFTYL